MAQSTNGEVVSQEMPCVCYHAHAATNFTVVDEALQYIKEVKEHITPGGSPCYYVGAKGRLTRTTLLTRVKIKDSSLFNYLITLDEINSLFSFTDD